MKIELSLFCIGLITDREGSETVAQDTLTNKCNTKDLCSFWLENHPAQHLAGNNPIMTFNETSQFESVKRASKKKQMLCLCATLTEIVFMYLCIGPICLVQVMIGLFPARCWAGRFSNQNEQRSLVLHLLEYLGQQFRIPLGPLSSQY